MLTQHTSDIHLTIDLKKKKSLDYKPLSSSCWKMYRPKAKTQCSSEILLSKLGSFNDFAPIYPNLLMNDPNILKFYSIQYTLR